MRATKLGHRGSAGRSTWLGNLELGDGWAVWHGSIGGGAYHRHLAAQAVLSDEPVRVTRFDGLSVHSKCVLIDPLVVHKLDAAPCGTIFYMEPGLSRSTVPSHILGWLKAADASGMCRGKDTPGFSEQWLCAQEYDDHLGIDLRITMAIDAVEALLSAGVVTLERASKFAYLSPERFRHKFAAEVGMSFRRYLLWRRLRLAAEELQKGVSLTAAAYAAAFADSTHLSRTLKLMFGISLSQLLLTGLDQTSTGMR